MDIGFTATQKSTLDMALVDAPPEDEPVGLDMGAQWMECQRFIIDLKPVKGCRYDGSEATHCIRRDNTVSVLAVAGLAAVSLTIKPSIAFASQPFLYHCGQEDSYGLLLYKEGN
ncbi:hypothetical protein Tco_1568289 [Tanacetum coccineum]